MSLFQDQISVWLSRRGPDRSLNQCFELPIVLGTDIGLQRSENQDRVAAIRIGSNAVDGQPLVAIAVVDGMGGMRDGGKCATLTLSSFFHALAMDRSRDLRGRVAAAISHANKEVFRFAGGNGGATLSAALVDQESHPLIVNIGDSRVYGFGGGAKVERLTRDDSLAEAVGGHGRELLQFIGMGEGMQPHIRSIPATVHNLAMTTDGIHFVESATLETILMHAVELKSASERLAALARWCGGPDNASSAIVGLQSLVEQPRRVGDHGVELWDPFGSLAAIWIRDEAAGGRDRPEIVPRPENAVPRRSHSSLPHGLEPAHSKRKASSKRSKRAEKPSPPKEHIQLNIEIEASQNLDGTDENSW